jgi:hypothetical protein
MEKKQHHTPMLSTRSGVEPIDASPNGRPALIEMQATSTIPPAFTCGGNIKLPPPLLDKY